MTPAECAAALKKPIGDVGFGFMTDPLTRERGRTFGLRGRPLYFLGRGGALGDVPAEVVVAAFAFFPPDAVVEHWNAGRQVMAPLDAAELYAQLCAEWGRRTYPDTADAGRALGLLERACDAAEPAGLPLFAGWRLLPRPDDVPGRLAVVMNVLREHRGGVHACAVAAVGLHPLDATLAGSYGEAGAEFAGWPKPYRDASAYKPRWDAAEDLTAAAAALPFDALSAEERVELVELVSRVCPA